MKRVAFVVVWLPVALIFAQQPVNCTGPLSEAQLTDLVHYLPEVRLKLFVKTCGIAFSYSGSVAARLRTAGATPELLAEIERRAPKAPGPAARSMNAIGMEFVRIPPGEFEMGSEIGAEDQKPVHRVLITKSFEMGKYEVTQGQWEAVMGANPSRFRGADRPVETVSWEDAQEFLSKLNASWDGYRYRLPNEAEWEYAARGGRSGEPADLDAVAWYGQNSRGETHPVGQKQANAWGLHDMLGNVWEWCQDWYDSNYYGRSPSAGPQGPGSGQDRVVRGGSWYYDATGARVSLRIKVDPSIKLIFLGFRCVREIP